RFRLLPGPHGADPRWPAVPPRRLGLRREGRRLRMLAYKDGARVRLISRNAVDWTSRFRELAAAIAKLPADVLVLDGEVAVFDKNLVSRFHLLGDNDTGVLCTPPIYIGFDVLQVGTRDLRARSLAERRVFLEDQLDGHMMVLPCRRLPDDG